MESHSIVLAKHLLGAFSIVLAAGIAGGALAKKMWVPDVALFLLVGLALGPSALGWVDIPASSGVNQIILIFGSCYILFDGGATLRFGVLKQVWITIAIVSTLGVLITAAITAMAAQYLLGLAPIVALLLGAAIASTDPATLVPIFKQVKIRDRVAQTVMSESAFNDAMGAILTFTVLGIAMGGGGFEASHSLKELLVQAGVGTLVGGVTGYITAFLIGHPKYPFLSSFAPALTLMAVFAAYLCADSFGASGFMAVFVYGLLIGNKNVFGFTLGDAVAHTMESFAEQVALIMRLMIFTLLGTQVDFGLIAQYWLPGLGVALVFIFIARPLTVFFCALPDRRAKWTLNEMLFMCWTRETGVIPAALSGLLIGMKAPGADVIAAVTFIAILLTILVQATTTRWLAQRLGLLEEDEKGRESEAAVSQVAGAN